MSGSRKRPSPSQIARDKKKSSLPKWLITIQSQQQTSEADSSDTTSEPESTLDVHAAPIIAARVTTTTATNAPTTAPIIRPTRFISRPTSLIGHQTTQVAPIRDVNATTTAPIIQPTCPVTRPTTLIGRSTASIRAPVGRPTTLISQPAAATPLPAAATIPVPNPHISDPESSSSRPSSSVTVDVAREKRLTIWVEDKKICPSSLASKRLRECFHLNLELKGYQSKLVSKETHDFYFREFQKRCQWDEAIDSLVKVAYNSFMKEVYRKMVYGLKNKEHQVFMSEEVYDSWVAYWKSEEGMKRSRQGSLARHGGTEGGPMSCHTAGSLSMREHHDRLSRLLGRSINAYELFVYTHTRKHDGVTWVDDRSRTIHERVTTTEERMREASDQVIDVQRVFYESVGGFKNRSRIYGLGDGSGFYASQPRYENGAPFSTTSSVLQMPQMTEQVNQLERDMQSLVTDRQADQERLGGVESHLESVLRLVRDLKSEMELLRMDIFSSNESHGSPSPYG
ncbi:hypothetical protein M5689_010848 [Euphorbia peplus]|nr:hypothetical protein M5689_010848 [Euphorbia peplus]